MQLKTDILKEAIDIVSAVTSSDEPIDLKKSSAPPHPTDTLAKKIRSFCTCTMQR
jgi:hypothetical protein